MRFHAANAVLLSKDLEFSKHSAVIASFGRDFVRPRLVDPKYHKIFIDAFEARQTAEYDIFKVVTRQFADKIFGEAQDFVAMADSYLS